MYKQKVIFFFSIIIPPVLLPILAFCFFIQYPFYIENACYWIKEGFLIKEHRAEAIHQPKILLPSGSNTLFGICTPLLEEKTNQKIINFGENAYTPIEIYFGLIKKYAKPNDIVIMPLEYDFYTKDKTFQDWVIRGLLTWGVEFIKEFSVPQIITIYFKSLPYIPERIKNYKVKLPIQTYEEYSAHINQSAIIAKSRKHQYNIFGDILVEMLIVN